MAFPFNKNSTEGFDPQQEYEGKYLCSFISNLMMASGASAFPQIEQGVIFEADDSNYLYTTASERTTPTSVKQFALHMRVKRTELSSNQALFYGGNPGGSVAESVRFDTSDRLQISCATAATYDLVTTQVFRDTTNHYDILVVFDIENVTSSERIRLYVNGERVTDFSTGTYPATTFNSEFTGNTASTEFVIGSDSHSSSSQFLCGIVSDVHLLDGQQPVPGDFGEFDSNTPTYWRYTPYTGDVGANGGFWDFYDAQAYGRDASGTENLSSAPSGWSWSGSGTTTGSYGTDPIGQTTIKAEDTNAAGTSDLGTTLSSGFLTSTKYAASVVLKYIDSKTVRMDMYGSGVTAAAAIYAHPEDGTISLDGSNDPEEYGVADLGDGYYRFWWTGTTAASSASMNFRAHVSWNASAKSTSGVGSGLGSVEMSSVSVRVGSELYPWAAYGSGANDLLASGFATTNQVTDTPTNNAANLSSIVSAATISNGGVTATATSSVYQWAITPIAIPTTGKWTFEAQRTAGTFGYIGIFQNGNHTVRTGNNYMYGVNVGSASSNVVKNSSVLGSTTTASPGASLIRIEYDADLDEIEIYDDDVLTWGPATVGLTGHNTLHFGVAPFAASTSFDVQFKDLTDTPTADFLELTAANLDDPTILDPSLYVDVVEWAGTGASKNVEDFNFDPDLAWLWNSDTAARNKNMYDTIRGATAKINSNSPNAESTVATGLTAFISNGFTVGSNSDDNENTKALWAAGWRESVTAGFDIVSYSGTGSAQNIGHSLGVTPELIMVKNRSSSGDWAVYHSGVASDPETDYLRLSGTNAATDDVAAWNDTAPTSSQFTVGVGSFVNNSGDDFIAYVFASIAGFSKAGSYTGNGSVDGPVIHLGFKPRIVLIKKNAAQEWQLYDSKRDPYNEVRGRMVPDDTSAESRLTTDNNLDFLSNGFKIREDNAGMNTSAGLYVYMAWAESPFKYTNAA